MRGRKPSGPSCTMCLKLRTRRGIFRCAEGVDRERAFKPGSFLTEWLTSREGQTWAYQTAGACPWFEGEEGDRQYNGEDAEAAVHSGDVAGDAPVARASEAARADSLGDLGR